MLLNTEQPVHRRAISLTPLIDVVFILLLFFMLSSTFMQWRQIDVSAASETEAEAKKQRVITLLSDAGDFKIDDKTHSIKSESVLKQIVQQDQEAVYVIKVMPGLRTQSMINLLDAFKQAGASSVTLAGVN
jgi:biopolymer transport protein ExbD